MSETPKKKRIPDNGPQQRLGGYGPYNEQPDPRYASAADRIRAGMNRQYGPYGGGAYGSYNAGGAYDGGPYGSYGNSGGQYYSVDPSWPLKSKGVAAALAIFLGTIGAHRFYLGSYGMGLLYLVFCWTGIPTIAGIIEGLVYLGTDDTAFELKHQVRIR